MAFLAGSTGQNITKWLKYETEIISASYVISLKENKFTIDEYWFHKQEAKRKFLKNSWTLFGNEQFKQYFMDINTFRLKILKFFCMIYD